jgi:hypothetical protein
MSKKLIALIILIIAASCASVIISHYYSQGKEKFEGNYSVLLLCVDTSEQRPGLGAIDMAFVINVNHGKVVNMTPIYPGGMAHPTLTPTADMQSYGITKYYLHDSLWNSDVESGAKIAQETVEYNTGLKTDLIVIVTPESIDAIINAIGPIYVEGQGNVTGDAVNFLRDEQNDSGMSRGSAVESLMDGIKDAAENQSNRKAMIETVSSQYSQGHIYVFPSEVFQQFITYEGINNLF